MHDNADPLLRDASGATPQNAESQSMAGHFLPEFAPQRVISRSLAPACLVDYSGSVVLGPVPLARYF
jgi:hypothetical protein